MDSPGHPIHLCFQPMYLRACHVPGGCWRKGAAQLLPLGSSQPGLVPRLKGTLQAGSAGAPSWGLWGRDALGEQPSCWCCHMQANHRWREKKRYRGSESSRNDHFLVFFHIKNALSISTVNKIFFFSKDMQIIYILYRWIHLGLTSAQHLNICLGCKLYSDLKKKVQILVMRCPIILAFGHIFSTFKYVFLSLKCG